MITVRMSPSPGVARGIMSGNGASVWSGCGANALPEVELRLQILFQNRHLDRKAAVVGEYDADEFVAGMQIG
jgi:hypothetical protein